jgi:catechol 2,3-dioxygenase-like lactoylglutathione lyase family enzyme
VWVTKAAPKRPHIYGIAYVRIATSDMEKAQDFYSLVLKSIPGADGTETPCDWCERHTGGMGTGEKRVGPVLLEPAQSPAGANLLKEVALRTDDAKELRKYLEKNQIKVQKLVKCGEDACFSVIDPEQHRLTFVETAGGQPVAVPGMVTAVPWSSPIIHAGFVVHDRAATDHFYKDILGFRPYWHGGMKDDKDDWVALQVPDGHDWVEYMLNIAPDAGKHTLGVMNHIAIGVVDIEATKALLVKNGWKPTEEPKLGRDGKWQLNLYDPDETRVEFMEFAPKEKPCCSEFTAAHPAPQR